MRAVKFSVASLPLFCQATREQLGYNDGQDTHQRGEGTSKIKVERRFSQNESKIQSTKYLIRPLKVMTEIQSSAFSARIWLEWQKTNGCVGFGCLYSDIRRKTDFSSWPPKLAAVFPSLTHTSVQYVWSYRQWSPEVPAGRFWYSWTELDWLFPPVSSVCAELRLAGWL